MECNHSLTLETIKMFCPEDEFEKNSKSITAHQKASLGNKNLEKYLEAVLS